MRFGVDVTEASSYLVCNGRLQIEDCRGRQSSLLAKYGSECGQKDGVAVPTTVGTVSKRISDQC